MRVTSDVMVAMRDGVNIAVRIYQPDDDGAYPTLFAISPYRYDTDDIPVHNLFQWRETGPVEWYVDQGYTYVHADVRGSGKSGGTYGFFDHTEQQDNYELIEWIAEQPWSTGKIGGIGQSYYAMAQWFMGISNPPHLTCLAPYDGMIDMYRDSAYNGGIYSEFFVWWYNLVRANNMFRAAGDNTGRAMEPDIALELMRHQTYDDWWDERAAHPHLSEIKVPVLSVGAWGKVGLHLRGNLIAYEELQSPKKLVVTGAANINEAMHMFDQPEFHQRFFKPFYDHHLKGVDNGVMDEPPVTIFVRGIDEYRDEAEWPIARAEYVSYYLSGEPSGSVTSLNDGSLTAEAPSGSPADDPTDEGGTTSYDYPDPQWFLGVVAMGKFGPDPAARVLTFTSAPLDHDTEVSGPIVLELFASSDQPDTDFVVKLSDQLPQSNEQRAEGRQPAFAPVTKGWLKASHRDKDEDRSTAYRPFYRHAAPQPLVAGEVYRFEIEVHPTAHVFKAGHRIRLEIANGDSPLTDAVFTHQYMPHKVGRDTVFHNGDHPSRLLLPVVPAQRP